MSYRDTAFLAGRHALVIYAVGTLCLRLKRVISQALGHDTRRRRPTPTDGMAPAVRIEPLAKADVASAVELAVRVLRVKPGDEAARSPVATAFLLQRPARKRPFS
jgi:hypothetical protein